MSNVLPFGSGAGSAPPPPRLTSTEAFHTLQPKGGGGGSVDLLHIDRQCDYRRKRKGKKKNQATVTPDHYPQSTAFTNRIKGRLVKMMLQRKREEGGEKTSVMEYTTLALD